MKRSVATNALTLIDIRKIDLGAKPNFESNESKALDTSGLEIRQIYQPFTR